MSMFGQKLITGSCSGVFTYCRGGYFRNAKGRHPVVALGLSREVSYPVGYLIFWFGKVIFVSECC